MKTAPKCRRFTPLQIPSTMSLYLGAMILLASLISCKGPTTETPLTRQEKQCRAFRSDLYVVLRRLNSVSKQPKKNKLVLYTEVAKLMNPTSGFYTRGCALCVLSMRYRHRRKVQFVRRCIKLAQRSHESLNRLAESYRMSIREEKFSASRTNIRNISSARKNPPHKSKTQNKALLRQLTIAHEDTVQLFSAAITNIYRHVRATKEEDKKSKQLLEAYKKKQR